MKQLFITLIFLALLLTTSFSAATSCIGYNESFDVRVLDAKLRPVEGAIVTVTFDRGTSFGQKYFTTQPRQTNASGMLHFSIMNQGTTTRKMDCDITINATVGTAKRTKIVQANLHGPIVDVNVSAYRLDIVVNDQGSRPIENATITIGGVSEFTGKDGRTRFYIGKGTVEYLVSYYRGKDSGTILVTDDTYYEIILHKYTIKINAVDDAGEPVNATLDIFNSTLTMQNGNYETGDVYGNAVSATLIYGGITKDIVIRPAIENEVRVVFDMHSPTIQNTNVTMVGKRPRLTFMVTDNGQYASGVDVTSVKVSYHILPSEGISQWTSATTFVNGANTFVADFPETESNKVIEFNIEAKDNEGNKVTRAGKFVIQKEEKPGDKPQEEEKNDQSIPLFYIIIGVILIIVVVYIVKYINNARGNGV